MITFFKNSGRMKDFIRCTVSLSLSLTVLLSCATASTAANISGTPVAVSALSDSVSSRAAYREVTVYIDGERYSGATRLINGTTFVGIREFTDLTETASVEWVQSQSAAYVTNPRVAIRAINGKEYIMSNGRYFWGREKNFIVDGTMYVPLRAICSSFGMSVSWNAQEFAAYVTRGNGTVTEWYEFYDEDEVYWLSKIIEAESRGEPMLGKIAVGNVVLNRVRSDEFPDTIYSVIFDRKHGVQFSPVADGSIHRAPSEDSIIAAKMCLEGYTVTGSALYFINASTAQDFWVTYNRPYVTTIGNHDFYA